MFKELNPLLHSELRLAVMSLLIGVEEADFVFFLTGQVGTASYKTIVCLYPATDGGNGGQPQRAD